MSSLIKHSIPIRHAGHVHGHVYIDTSGVISVDLHGVPGHSDRYRHIRSPEFIRLIEHRVRTANWAPIVLHRHHPGHLISGSQGLESALVPVEIHEYRRQKLERDDKRKKEN